MIPRNWTRSDLATVLPVLESLPDSLPVALSQDFGDYYAAFYPAALAYGEAVQMTGSGNSVSNELGLALNLARIGDAQAAQAYALALSKALNKGLSDLPSLADWLGVRQSMLTFRYHPLPAANGAYARALLEITGSGSALILIEQMPGGYHAVPLASLFDFTNPVESRLIFGDLTGDGEREVIFWQLPPQGISAVSYPVVYDLASIPPKRLSFMPKEQLVMELEYTGDWSVVSNKGKGALLDLHVKALPACPISIHRQYRWDGRWLARIAGEYKVQANNQVLGYCSLLIDHTLQVWEPAAAVQVIEHLLPAWPPANLDGAPPPMTKQEMLTHQGIAYALQGNFTKAGEILAQAATSQTPNDDYWMGEAQKFLAAYRKEEDIYRACVGTQACEPRLALPILSTMIKSDDERDQSILKRLTPLGVIVRASGSYDFDGDGRKELWFTLAPRPGAYLEFWILTRNEQSIQFLFVDTLNTNLPIPEIIDNIEKPAIVEVDEQTAFRFFKAAGGADAYTQAYTGDHYWDIYLPNLLRYNAGKYIFGGSSQTIASDLLELKNDGRFFCSVERTPCAMYYALLGAACQQSGDAKCAVDNYLNAWRRFPSSPFTTYVRLRLTRAPKAPTLTPTPSPTITPFGGKTYTPVPRPPQPSRTKTPKPLVSQYPVTNE